MLFKLLLIASAVFTIGATASASVGDDAIYNALVLRERNITPPRLVGAVWYEKSIGGLVCERIEPVVPHPIAQYSCTLSAHRHSAAIWAALDVPVEHVNQNGYWYFVKSVGGLICSHAAVRPGVMPLYTCVLD